MALPVPPYNPTRRIPNNPFYTPESFALQGTIGPIVVGSGLNIDYTTNTISSTGGGGGAVAQVTGSGAGINVTPTTGNVVVTNTGVTSLIAGSGITLSGATGTVTISAAGGGGTVTCVGAGPGLAGGPVNTVGTLCLPTITTITPAPYTNANITVDAFGRVIAVSNGTVSGGTVTALTACCGIITNPVGGVTSTGSVALSNTGVTAATYSYPTITVDGQGRITSASSNTPCSGTVTSVAISTGLCLTGGGISFTNSGTIALCDTTVSPGSYTNASLTVDQQGRLTAASSGVTPVTAVSGTAPIAVSAGATPNVSIASSSTTALGAVQLTNALNSSSETLALTACAGACLQSQITALATTPGIELAGTIDASTGFVDSVTTIGTGAGYTVGAVLPAASATTVNTYVIVTTPGTLTPPGGSPTAATKGDWFLASETSPSVYAWQFLNVGFDAPPATTSVAGVVCLSTNALAQAGTDTTTALTPAAGASAYIPKSTVTGKGAVLTGTAAGAPSALPAGSDGCALIACAACPCGLTWGAAGGIAATPTVAGTVFGCTLSAGLGNTALGFESLKVATGCYNTAIGLCSGQVLTSGCCNTLLGKEAGASVTTCSNNVVIGTSAALNGQPSESVVIGVQAGNGNANGNSNVLIGTCVGAPGVGAPSISNSVVIGASAMTRVDHTGSCIVAIGPNVSLGGNSESCAMVIGFGLCNWICGNSNLSIKPGAGIIDCANSCGTVGQVLMSTGANKLCWGTIGAATPTALGLVLGCTLAANTALGCNALLVNASSGNTAVGDCALTATTTGDNNTGIGSRALLSNTTGVNNVAVGARTLSVNTTGGFNVAVGRNALCSNTVGCCNIAIGYDAGCAITTGYCNIAIGPSVQVAAPAGCCQLAIGFSATCNWLTGDSSKNIQPGAGIKDCTASVGTAGQILSSTGTAIAWRSGCVQQTASCTATVVLSSEITTRKLNNGDSLTIYNSNAAVPPVAIQVTATSLTNYQSYPTQATSAVFTLPPSGSVTLVLADSATNTWYIESYDTPEQVGTVVAKATLSASFALSVATKIPFDVGTFNPQGYFNTTTNRFQPLVAGYYQVNAQLYGDTTNWLITQVRKNGVTEIQSEQTSSPNSEAVLAAGIVYLNGSTDYLEVWGIPSPSVTLSANAATTYFTASLINQTNTRVVGIDATASMRVTAGTIPNGGSVEVIPGINGVAVAEDFDPQSWFDTTTGRFTPTIPGYYQVNVVVTSNASARNTWGGIFKNGALFGEAIATVSGSTGDWNSAVYSAVVFMNGTTDYLRMGAGYQGSTAGFAPSTGGNRMSIALVGANQAQPLPPMTWISAGTVQSVGLGSVISGTLTPGTAPTITAASQNNIRYRQIGPKEWEVQGILFFTNGTAGSGDYVFTLPGGLQFDLTSPYQLPYTAGPNFSIGWYAYGLPNAWVKFSQSGAVTTFESMIMPLDATRYRIVPVGPDGDKFWSAGYYGLGAYASYRKWSFTFFTP